MKVLFVNPFQVDLVHTKGRIYNRVWPPLDLAYCAAVLERDGNSVEVLDAHAEQLGVADVAQRARAFDTAFVTSTTLDRWQCPHLDLNHFFRVVDALKAVVPNVYVMGSHGTVRPADILRLTGVRAVVRGEPENTVADIVRHPSLDGVRGITLLDNGKVVDRPEQPAVVMDNLPLPAFHRLPMDRYYYEVMGRRFSLFEMSRGCASECTFCLLTMYGGGVRKKSTDALIREVEYGITKFRVRNAYFIDLEFTVLRKQVLELCNYLIRANHDFRWCCQTRLDLVDADLLRAMKRAGCCLIHVGVEAGSDRILERVRKGITVEAIRRGMALIKASGINTACFFMFGFPDAEPGDMHDIVRFAKELAPTYPLFHIATPYPGTQLHDDVRRIPDARFSDDSLFPEAIEGGLTLRDLKAMTRRAYMSYYLRPSYVLGRLTHGDFRVLAEQLRLFWNFLRA